MLFVLKIFQDGRLFLLPKAKKSRKSRHNAEKRGENYEYNLSRENSQPDQ